MPIYSYRCEQCGPFSQMQALSEYDRPQPCPTCEAPASRTLNSPAVAGNADISAKPAQPPRAHLAGCSCCRAGSAPMRAEAL